MWVRKRVPDDTTRSTLLNSGIDEAPGGDIEDTLGDEMF